MEKLKKRAAFICDMDGVVYHGNRLPPGAKEFVTWLKHERKRFLFLTNSSERSPRELAQKLARRGANLIGTNPDLTGPSEHGIVPSTGALIAPIELATGQKAYFAGKPNPLMMRNALKKLETRREDTVIIGDRMDTDIIAGIEAEIETVLVLSGVTAREDLSRFAYTPHYILEGIGVILGEP